jgi:tetratricopeptide (TPR) repeat protein
MSAGRVVRMHAVILLAACGLSLSVPVFADTYADALHEGERLFKAEKYDDAQKAFALAVEAPDPQIAKFACAYMGLSSYRKGDSDQAVAWYERALEKDAGYMWVLENLTVLCFDRQNTYLKGLKLGERAEALFSREPWVYYSMARYYAFAGNADLAVRSIDKALYFGFFRPDVPVLRPNSQSVLALGNLSRTRRDCSRL